MTNQNDLTLNNIEARDKVKQLFKTMIDFDEDAKRLDIGLKNKQPLSILMMDVLPPKWTEIFQHQQVHNENIQSHRSHHCHRPTHYNTYQACTIHDRHHHHHHSIPNSHCKFCENLYSSNPSIINTTSSTNK
ncbi:unnamed protein product, partial [Rotaria sp. Silwood1]